MGKVGYFVGHGPKRLKLPFDITSDENLEVIARFKELIEDFYEQGVTEWWSGMTLGSAMLFFIAVHSCKREGLEVKNNLALPFKKYSSVWGQELVETARGLETLADQVVFVDSVDGYGVNNVIEGEYHPQKYKDRDTYAFARMDLCVAYYLDLDVNEVFSSNTATTVSRVLELGRELVTVNPETLERTVHEAKVELPKSEEEKQKVREEQDNFLTEIYRAEKGNVVLVEEAIEKARDSVVEENAFSSIFQGR